MAAPHGQFIALQAFNALKEKISGYVAGGPTRGEEKKVFQWIECCVLMDISTENKVTV